jgi:hypothetical protein
MRLQGTVWALSICLLFTIGGNAQSKQRPVNPPPQGGAGMPIPPPDPIGEGNSDESTRRAMHEMEKKANLERQAALKKDTEKLLKLAEELKNSVDKSSASVLSLEVMKKAEEIEKLAHSVKDKMKGPN